MSTLELYVISPFKTILLNFFKEQSNRRRLDNKYTECIFIEEWIKGKHITIKWNEDKLDLRIKRRLQEKVDMLKKLLIENYVNIDLYNLNIKDYSLFWRSKLIYDAYRAWAKNVTYARYKNESINSELANDIFYYNILQEFDWKYTLEFIPNKMKFSSMWNALMLL